MLKFVSRQQNLKTREERLSVLNNIRPKPGKRFLLILLGIFAGIASPMTSVQADEEPKSSEVAPSETEAEAKPRVEVNSGLKQALETLQQLADDEVSALIAEPASPAAEKQRSALAYYMSGRTLEREKKYLEAYQAYENGLKLDPNSLTLYRAMIPLAFRLNRAEEAIVLAQKAVELDPNNFELLSQLGIYALRQQDLQRSILYFERAVQSENVNKKSGPYVSILSQLGQLYLSLGNSAKAAEAYEVVFDAISNPEAYNLDFRTTQALETLRGSKAETLEAFGELFLITDRLELAKKAFSKGREASRRNQGIFNYQQARVLNKEKNYSQALEELQKYFAEKLSQKGRGPYLLLSELLNASGRGDETINELEKLAAQDEKNEELQFYLADQYIHRDRLEDAEKIYQQHLETAKNKGEIYLGLLQVYRKREDAAKAVEALARAMMNGASNPRLEAELERISQNEKLADAMIELAQKQEDADIEKRELFSQAYLLGKLGMQRKNHEAVIDFYQRALALEMRSDPRFQLTLYDELVRFLISEKQFEQCTKVLEDAIDKPELAAFRQVLQLELIKTLAQSKKIDEALAVTTTLIESDPENLRFLYQPGLIHYINENWEEAIKTFGPLLEKAIEQENSEIERDLRYNLSRCLAFAGMTSEALQLMNQTIEQEPDELLWLFQKGWINYYARNWDAAIEAFKDLIAKGGNGGPDDRLIRQARFSLSAAYVQNEQLDEGEKVLEEVYKQDPNDISVCNDLGYLYADRGKNLEQAHEMIKKAVDAEPENQAYLDSLGWVLFRLEKYDEALEYLLKAVANSEKGDAVIWDHLGDCYQKLEQPEKAKEAWKTAAEHERGENHPNKKLLGQIEEKLKSAE